MGEKEQKQKPGSLSRMPTERLEKRAEAFAKAMNRKGLPTTFGAGKKDAPKK